MEADNPFVATALGLVQNSIDVTMALAVDYCYLCHDDPFCDHFDLVILNGVLVDHPDRDLLNAIVFVCDHCDLLTSTWTYVFRVRLYDLPARPLWLCLTFPRFSFSVRSLRQLPLRHHRQSLGRRVPEATL